MDKDIPDWSIKPETDSLAQDYWKFIFVKHQAAFAREYSARPAEYPPGWNSITEEMARDNISTFIF